MSPLTVLQVAESFATGTMEVVRQVAAGVADAGHRSVIAYGRRPETPPDVAGVVDPRVELVELPWTSRTPGAQMAAARELRRLRRGLAPDVIHLHSSFAGFIGVAAAGTVPTVYTPHGYSFLAASGRAQRAAYRLAERAVARRATLVGAVSADEANLAEGVGARRVVVVPNGIPELDERVAGQPAPGEVGRRERPLVVTMGRIVRQRRPLATARILAAVADIADVRWIGGPGPDPDLAGEVEALGVPSTGWLPREEAVELLRGASVLVNWSEWDSHPLSVLEAMAADVPVVGSDIAANRDLVGPDQVRGTEDEAVTLIRRLLADERTRRRVLDQQAERRTLFSSRRMCDDWLAVYRGLAEGRDPVLIRGRLTPATAELD